MEADEIDTPTTDTLIAETTTPALDADDGKTVEPAPPITFESLNARVAALEESNARMLTVLLGIASMPEHSSLGRKFAARCEDILHGRVRIALPTAI